SGCTSPLRNTQGLLLSLPARSRKKRSAVPRKKRNGDSVKARYFSATPAGLRAARALWKVTNASFRYARRAGPVGSLGSAARGGNGAHPTLPSTGRGEDWTVAGGTRGSRRT